MVRPHRLHRRCHYPSQLTLLAGLLVMVGGAARAQVEDPALAERIARVEQTIVPIVQAGGSGRRGTASIGARMRAYRVPGVSIAVIHEGRLEWAKAYGLADVDAERAADTETLFQAASMSKPVAAMAALSLVGAERLALDEDVTAKLRSWRLPSSPLTARRPVTLRGLLTHTAGLNVHGFPGYAAGEALPEVVDILDGGPPANTPAVVVQREPGTRWQYSGGGYTLLQLLMTDVTGIAFPELMHETVLAPLGMAASTYAQPLPEALAARAATGYRADGRPIPGGYHAYPEMAAAGLWTTPSDLARWIIEVQSALADGSARVLSRAMTEAMLTAGTGGWGLGPSLGELNGAPVFGHGGANEGFRGELIGFAHHGAGAVVMTNSDAGGLLVQEILAAIAREYGWQAFSAP